MADSSEELRRIQCELAADLNDFGRAEAVDAGWLSLFGKPAALRVDAVVSATMETMSRLYYTQTRMPGHQKETDGYDRPIWCVAAQHENNPPQCLPGADMRNLMFEDAQQKAEELEARAESE